MNADEDGDPSATERTLAAGVTNLVRVEPWSVTPTLAGLFMQGGSRSPRF